MRTARYATQPEFNQLRDEYDTALSQIESGTVAEKRAMAGIVAAARQAMPQVDKAYRQALGDIGYSGPEAARTRSRVAEDRATNRTSLVNRQMRARDSMVQNTRNFRAQRQQATADFYKKRSQLAQQRRGTFLSTLDELRDERQAQRNADRTFNRDKYESNRSFKLEQQKYGHEVAQDTLSFINDLVKGVRDGGLSPSERRSQHKAHHDVQAQVALAREWIGNLRQGGNSLSQIRSKLITGASIPQEQNGRKFTLRIPQIDRQYVDRAIAQIEREQRRLYGAHGTAG